MPNFKSNYSHFKLIEGSPIRIRFYDLEILVKIPTVLETKDNELVMQALSFISTDIKEMKAKSAITGLDADNLLDFVKGVLFFTKGAYTEALTYFITNFTNCSILEQEIRIGDKEINSDLMDDLRFYFVVGCGIEAEEAASMVLDSSRQGTGEQLSEARKYFLEKQKRSNDLIKKKNKKANQISEEDSLIRLIYFLSLHSKNFTFNELLNKNMFTINWVSELLDESQGSKNKNKGKTPFENLKR